MSFHEFDRVMRPHLRALYPEASVVEINHALCVRWQDLPPQEQAKFQPGAFPKNPTSSFGLFYQSVRHEYTDTNSSRLYSVIYRRWNRLSKAEKARFKFP